MPADVREENYPTDEALGLAITVVDDDESCCQVRLGDLLPAEASSRSISRRLGSTTFSSRLSHMIASKPIWKMMRWNTPVKHACD